jgi:hypothetical protein
MKIGHTFNQLTLKEYFFYIDHYKKYTDFNTLGLYRSLLENKKLGLEDKISVREYAHRTFKKSFDFLQLKDPWTFIKVSTLGQILTKGEEDQLWKQLRQNQEKMLERKQIRYRNFGVYSKHNCGYEDCRYNGLMIRQGSHLAEVSMHFDSDKNQYMFKEKSNLRKKERKTVKQIIDKELTEE